MSYLSFPFEKSATLIIKTGATKKTISVEVANSEIEIFQSLCYREIKDFKNPLALRFTNHLVQSLSLQEFTFDAEQILVEAESNVVRGVQFIKKSKFQGKNIQSYAGFSLAIIAPIGFAKKFGIALNKTIINIKKK